MRLKGIHHLTAITARARHNYEFYTQVVGMRLVKRSVNQDDVSAYHLFYADAVGSPGSDLTFFDWPVPPERRGTHSIVRTSLRLRGRESLEWWAERLDQKGVRRTGIVERDGRFTLDFEDPEGQRLSLVDDGGLGDEPQPWDRSPVPAKHQVRGLGPVLISVPDHAPTDAVLTRVMGMVEARRYTQPPTGPAGAGSDSEGSGTHSATPVHVYEMDGEGPQAELHVAVQPGLPPVRQGAGGVHHVAFRTPDHEYQAWATRLNALRVPNSGPVDRYYFRSLYFREPNGILFEIATDGPGFAVDEKAETLGESIVLPPFLEPDRERIVAGLKPLD